VWPYLVNKRSKLKLLQICVHPEISSLIHYSTCVIIFIIYEISMQPTAVGISSEKERRKECSIARPSVRPSVMIGTVIKVARYDIERYLTSILLPWPRAESKMLTQPCTNWGRHRAPQSRVRSLLQCSPACIQMKSVRTADKNVGLCRIRARLASAYRAKTRFAI